jgi:hypothetical protein
MGSRVSGRSLMLGYVGSLWFVGGSVGWLATRLAGRVADYLRGMVQCLCGGGHEVGDQPAQKVLTKLVFHEGDWMISLIRVTAFRVTAASTSRSPHLSSPPRDPKFRPLMPPPFQACIPTEAMTR